MNLSVRKPCKSLDVDLKENNGRMIERILFYEIQGFRTVAVQGLESPFEFVSRVRKRGLWVVVIGFLGILCRLTC